MIAFDNSPTCYWLIGYTWAVLLILSLHWYKKVNTTLFLAGSFILLTFMRLPVLVFNRELNPDESQMLSHAITLVHDPVYWRSVDGTTIGPLDIYLLIVPKFFGLQIDYTSGRIMGLLCVISALFCIFSTLKIWFGDLRARTVLLILIFFFGFTQEADFVHYSSEHLPFFLLSFCFLLLTKITRQDQKFFLKNYSIGLIAGMLPFAKLQAVPLAFVIVLAAVWLCYRFYQKSNQYYPLAGLVLGGVTFPFLIFSWAFYYDLMSDIVDFYLLSNIMYADNNKSILDQFRLIYSLSPDFKALSYIVFISLSASAKTLAAQKNPALIKKTLLRVVVIALFLAGVFAATKSGKDFVHYLIFCIIPWSFLLAFGTSRLGRWALVLPLFLMLYFFSADLISYKNWGGFNKYASFEGSSRLGQSPVVKALKKYSNDKDCMVVWGWNCSYYVEAQLPEGTAENHTERSIYESKMLNRYQQRYIADIKRTKPAFFLDAAGKNSLWLQNKEIHGYQTHEDLARYIDSNYTLVGDFDDTRLYVVNERIRSCPF